MRLNVASPRRVLAGLLFAAIGAGSLLVSSGYRMGTALHMGPGYYPAAIGVLLLLTGLAAAVQGLTLPTLARPALSLRPALLITAAAALFAATIDRIGLLAAVFLAVLVAACAARPIRPIETLVVATTLAAASALIFLYALQLPFRLLP